MNRSLAIPQPQSGKVVAFSSAGGLFAGGLGYYDATASLPHRDFGSVRAGSEDMFFHGRARQIALARIRREIRSNPYLAGLVRKFPEACGHARLRSRTSSREYNAVKDLFWYRYSKSITTRGDSLRRVQLMRWHEHLVAGELFWVLLPNGKIQPIPSEFCGSPDSGTEAGESNGIIYSNGRPVAYRFGQRGPWGAIDYSFANSTVVDARYVIHDTDFDRIEMGRGLPLLLASLPHARDLYEITRSKGKQIKDANKFTGTIETERGKNFFDGFQGANFQPDTVTPAGDQAADAPLPTNGAQPVIELRDGTFIALEPGEKLNLLQQQYGASDYKELIMLMLHAISSPVGLPVELWFSGLGDVNYSGYKGLGTQWDSTRKQLLAAAEEVFLDRFHFWRTSKATKEGDLPPNPDGDDDLIQWAWRRTAVLDEEKAAKSNEVRLRTGDICVADIWEERGEYPDEVFARRREVWIQGLIAAGQITADADTSDIQVPLEFLYSGRLPGAAKEPAPAPAEPPAQSRTA